MTHVTCRLTAKNRDQLRNPTLGNRVRATFSFFNVLRSRAHIYFYNFRRSYANARVTTNEPTQTGSVLLLRQCDGSAVHSRFGLPVATRWPPPPPFSTSGARWHALRVGRRGVAVGIASASVHAAHRAVVDSRLRPRYAAAPCLYTTVHRPVAGPCWGRFPQEGQKNIFKRK